MELLLHTEFPFELENEWNALLAEGVSHVPFLRFEYLYEWWGTRGGGEWPDDSRLAVITAHEDGQLKGIAPFFIPEGEETKKLLLLGSIEISDYLDLICRAEDLDRFTLAVLGFIIQEMIPDLALTHLDLYNILEDSPTLESLERAAKELELDLDIQRLQHSPYIPLPGDWEGYLQKLDKKQRHEIRRKMRRAAEMEIPANLYVTSELTRLEDDMDDFLELMAQDEAKEDFLSPRMREQMKNVMRCAFAKGCLQLSFLMVGDQKVAGYFSFDYLNRIWVYNSGVDRQFMAYSPGWVLLGHLLQLANEEGREEFDFMRGNEDYKYKFGAVDRYIVRAQVVL